jgi:DNA-binding NarL/FixJ family response regulator
MKKLINVALADNQTIFRKGLISLLNGTGNIKVTSDAENGKNLLDQIRKKRPDVIILDIDMPVMNGIETTKILHKDYPDVKILILSIQINKAMIIEFIESGAHGFLLKDMSVDKVLEGIHSVRTSGYYLNDMISKIMIGSSLKNKKIQTSSCSVKLTSREIEIIKLLSQALGNSEIAKKLFITARTVQRHRENIRIKINVKNVNGVLMYAVKNNLLD